MTPRSTRARARLAILAPLALLVGCSTIGDRGQPLVPTQHHSRSGPFVIFTNQAAGLDDVVVKQLASLQAEFVEKLGLQVEANEQPIEVYILDDRKAFEHFLTFYYPDLPHRRAFFIAQGPRRVVYTFRGDRLVEDLRHEATHALLNLAAGDVPLWLDEGLAEYFEEANEHGLNLEHLARLPGDVEDGWAPDLPKLESIKVVRQMTPRDYRESWAWVHYLLHESPDGRALLLGYLGDLRSGKEPRPVSGLLKTPPPEAATALASHLKRVDREVAASRTPPKEPTVRLQDESPEPTIIPVKKRGFFARLFGRSTS